MATCPLPPVVRGICGVRLRREKEKRGNLQCEGSEKEEKEKCVVAKSGPRPSVSVSKSAHLESRPSPGQPSSTFLLVNG